MGGPIGDRSAQPVLTSTDFYEGYAKYVGHTHLQANGTHLSTGTAIDYLNDSIQMAKNRCFKRGAQETKDFFLCQNSKNQTQESKWLHGLRQSVIRETFMRAKENGEKIDKSPGLFV